MTIHLLVTCHWWQVSDDESLTTRLWMTSHRDKSMMTSHLLVTCHWWQVNDDESLTTRLWWQVTVTSQWWQVTYWWHVIGDKSMTMSHWQQGSDDKSSWQVSDDKSLVVHDNEDESMMTMTSWTSLAAAAESSVFPPRLHVHNVLRVPHLWELISKHLSNLDMFLRDWRSNPDVEWLLIYILFYVSLYRNSRHASTHMLRSAYQIKLTVYLRGLLPVFAFYFKNATVVIGLTSYATLKHVLPRELAHVHKIYISGTLHILYMLYILSLQFSSLLYLCRNFCNFCLISWTHMPKQ